MLSPISKANTFLTLKLLRTEKSTAGFRKNMNQNPPKSAMATGKGIVPSPTSELLQLLLKETTMQVLRLLILITLTVLVNAAPWVPIEYDSNRLMRSPEVDRDEFVGTQFMPMGSQIRFKRQYGYYGAPAYPGYYNPLGTGSAWAAGGGVVGNTLSFLVGK
ncbi:unnamed protein product [Cylicocyclus nassatus]|uniref:Uncharacterized protein n=1 Tax=Cylicocyclus nassatus TaxID=53992 RepID=A0AA36DQ64_CYLNA|nr:unnamed protein product [Cylicocyclus nassatus]